MSNLTRRSLLAAGTAGLVTACTPARVSPPPILVAPFGPPISAPDALLKDIQQRTFRYFWDSTDPVTGLAPDRWPTPSFASIAAIGFALTAYPIGVANGWITRDQARARVLTTLRFLAAAPQGDQPTGFSGYKGFFYHFLGMTRGHRFAKCELSTIDTALMMAGVLFVQSWFDAQDIREAEIRALAEQLYTAVEWTWITPRAPFVSMGWMPESGFISSDWNIYNESLILYLLALGSPSHPLPADTWTRWTDTFDPSWDASYVDAFTAFPPLFGHQYSQVWVDFRGMTDAYSRRRGIDYFENSRRATYAQQRYAIANPGGWVGYGEDVWGFTACDGPGDFVQEIDGRNREFFSYSARGPGDRDDGTIAPTAAFGSIAFAPEIVIPTAQAMIARYPGIYDEYGFRDSFNLTLKQTSHRLQHGSIVPGTGWVATDHLGIDQGPIVAMIENHRTGLVWNTMKRNPHLRRGLERAGFSGGWMA
ncbi:glucoamylase family protein [uncultured Sphingomonas sp.]|uniref:glucoamylase family protein n=1 Tax=Sphingomonas sp. TaxID=28214 RepID=UPI00262E8ACC|nr:glucoamylase family protein [uncultured Sphingomonas sp.]